MTGRRFESVLNFPGTGSSDAAGNLYFADYGNHRVVVLAPDGSLVRTVGQFGRMLAINDLTFLPDNSNVGSTCYDVWWNVLPRNDCSDEPSDKLGFFNLPNDVAVSADGNTFVVTDTFNFRIQVFTRSSNGSYFAGDGTRWNIKAIGQFKLDGDVGDFAAPWGVAVAPSQSMPGDYRIVVTESDNDRVQILDPVASGPTAQYGGVGRQPLSRDDLRQARRQQPGQRRSAV